MATLLMKMTLVIDVILVGLIDILVTDIASCNSYFGNTEPMVQQTLKEDIISSNVLIASLTLNAVLVSKLLILKLKILSSFLHQAETKTTDISGMIWTFCIFNRSKRAAAQVQAALLITPNRILEDQRKELGLNCFRNCLFRDVKLFIIDLKIELASSDGIERDEVCFEMDSRCLLWVQSEGMRHSWDNFGAVVSFLFLEKSIDKIFVYSASLPFHHLSSHTCFC